MTTSLVNDNLIAAVIPHDTLWAIEPGAGRRLWDSLKMQSMQQHVTVFAAQQAAKPAEEKPPKPFQMEGDTALFSLSGPMTKSPTSMGMGTSTVRLRRQIDLALADPDVKQAVLVIDSPGGSVSGTADLAATIARFAARKPVIACVEDCCCSAALWCASQCTQVFANPTAMIGSQGTVLRIDDSSRAYASDGVEPHLYVTGKYKGAGSDGTKITPEQDAYFQAMVDDLNSHFVAALRRGRPGITDDQMAAIADAGVYIGQSAVAMNLIDGIASFEECLSAVRALPRDYPTNKVKEKPLMRERLAAALAAVGATGLAARILGANTDDPAALAKILVLFDDLSQSGGAEPSPAPTPAAAPALTAAAIQAAVTKALAESQATTVGMIADLQAKLARTEANAQYEQDCNALQSLVRQMRLTPAAAEGWKAIAKTNHEAFAVALPQLQASPVLIELRGMPKRTPSASTGDDPGEKMVALAKEMAAKTGKPMDECLIAVSDANPELATSHLGNMQAEMRGN